MDPAELDRLLTQTLADRRAERPDRGALADWAARHPQEAERAAARGRAFGLAKSALEAEAGPVLTWLEDVVQVFARPAAAGPAEPAGAYFSPGTTCIHEVIRQFDRAGQSCDVCVFTITDDRITDAILRAHARGVAVRVITDDEKSHDLGSDIDRLRAAGVPCKMDVGNAAHMHHKFALFDARRLMTGSFNWTRSASEQNEENLIVTADPTLVRAFGERFETLWGRMT
jgi:phosphatidylserine/phosphatidylglycerophosphate/cardiolipin synthase-like enzyme